MAKTGNHNIIRGVISSFDWAWRFIRYFCWAWWISRLARRIYIYRLNKSVLNLRYRIIQDGISIRLKGLWVCLWSSDQIIIGWFIQLGFLAKSGFGTEKNRRKS